MIVCADMSPRRRVSANEERELLQAAGRLRAAEEQADRRRQERDELIADLLDGNARVADVAEILGITAKAVRDARERVHRR